MLFHYFTKFFKGSTRRQFLELYTLSVFFFSILYYLSSNYLEDAGFVDTYFKSKPEEITPLSYFDCLHFSLVTQTTVGYGRFEPYGTISRIINIFQLISIVFIFLIDNSVLI